MTDAGALDAGDAAPLVFPEHAGRAAAGRVATGVGRREAGSRRGRRSGAALPASGRRRLGRTNRDASPAMRDARPVAADPTLVAVWPGSRMAVLEDDGRSEDGMDGRERQKAVGSFEPSAPVRWPAVRPRPVGVDRP